MKMVAEKIFRYRYLIVFASFAFIVAMGLSGSSIGLFAEHLGGKDNGVIFGESRPIRSDECFVSTPMMFAQYYDPKGAFPYFSSVIRGSITDVFLEYGQPVLSIFSIFRPFYLGYLFLPISNGMAFYWFGRLIALFCVSFEFGRMITKDKKVLSLTYAFMIAFSPIVQWWFATNCLVEMLICIQLSILLFNRYLNDENKIHRIIYMLLIMLCAGTYIMTMYPSWQVPLAYCLIGLIIWQVLEHYKKTKLHAVDIISTFFLMCFLAAMILAVFLKSKVAIMSIMSTEYPGSRFEHGGGCLNMIFNYISNIWYGITGEGTYSDVCSSSFFIDMFPVCYIFPLYNVISSERKDKFTVIMLIISSFLGVWIVFGYPEFIAKITLLSNAQADRTVVAFGFCNILLLIRSISEFSDKKFGWIKTTIFSLFTAMMTVWIAKSIRADYYSVKMLVITSAIFVILFGGIWHFNKKCIKNVWCIVMIFTMCMSGIFVNPLRKGVEDIENTPVLNMMREVHKEDPNALWVVAHDNDYSLIMNCGLLIGAPTINSTNVYPNKERWYLIDPEKKYEYVYNRYAHIYVNLTEEENYDYKFEMVLARDMFLVHMNHNDLKTLGVTYVLSNNGSLPSEYYNYIDCAAGWFVYSVR